jgi:hypothetical protein
MATEIEARENASKISSQFRTMAAPPRVAQPRRLRVSLPTSEPVMAQTTNSVAAPKTQRQNNSSMIGCPERTTNQPMVPEISMAAIICSVPVVLFFISFERATWAGMTTAHDSYK